MGPDGPPPSAGPPAEGWRKAENGRWYPPDPPEKQASRTSWGVVIVGGGAVLAFAALLWSCLDSTPRTTSKPGPDQAGAIEVCERRVKEQLKSPATAKFSGVDVDDDSTFSDPPSSGTEYTVTGDVDSENGFGALVRSSWTCSAVSTGGDRYQVKATVR